MRPVAVITGASKGIGHQAAYYFAEQGYDVVLLSRNADVLDSLCHDLTTRFSVSAIPHALDVRDYEAVSACIQSVYASFKRVDVLFNNAGILMHETSAISPDEFNAMLDVNLRGVYHLIHCVVPIMKMQQSGYIMNLSSYAGKRPLPYSGAYCMTKYGVLGFSQSLSLELVKDNIKVTAICPSVVDTDMTHFIENFPNEEKITCQDILTTVDYLLKLSPHAYVDEITVKSTYAMGKELMSK